MITKKKVKKIINVFPRTKPNMGDSPSLDRANAEITQEINEISNEVARWHMLSQQERRIAESKMELKTAMEAHLMEQQTSLIAEVSGGRPKKEIVKIILRQCKTYNKKQIPKRLLRKTDSKNYAPSFLDCNITITMTLEGKQRTYSILGFQKKSFQKKRS